MHHDTNTSSVLTNHPLLADDDHNIPVNCIMDSKDIEKKDDDDDKTHHCHDVTLLKSDELFTKDERNTSKGSCKIVSNMPAQLIHAGTATVTNPFFTDNKQFEVKDEVSANAKSESKSE
uniref:Uncharacterized protein n=1 Tax=Lygus hesperus TaxID=30085 RepID=A0A0A9YXM6_LYGHE